MNLLIAPERRSIATALCSILAAVVLLLFSHHIHAAAAAAGTCPEDGVVAEVIDGDTVILTGGEKVRYLGINAPEVRVRAGKNWVYRPQLCGKEATDINRELVLGKWVYLEYDKKKRDDYGRLLAYVRVGTMLVNEELVKRGLALVDIRKPNYRYQECLLAAQQRARIQWEGLWRALSERRVEADEAFAHIGELAMVHGRVTGIRFSKGKVIVGFGQKEGKRFSAVVYREHLDLFSFPGDSLSEYLRSKRANVYGYIKDMGGPTIVVCAPSQFDVLE